MIAINWYILYHTADSKQGDLAASKEKEQQLQAMLDTRKHVSWAKDQHISSLEEELQAIQMKMTVISKENKELKMLQKKGIYP